MAKVMGPIQKFPFSVNQSAWYAAPVDIVSYEILFSTFDFMVFFKTNFTSYKMKYVLRMIIMGIITAKSIDHAVWENFCTF